MAQCYIRHKIEVPLVDLCKEALDCYTTKLPFLVPVDGPGWFPEPLVGDSDLDCTSYTPLAKDKHGLPFLRPSMERELSERFGDGPVPNRAVTPYVAPVPSRMPVALAVPLLEGGLNKHPRGGAPMEEYEEPTLSAYEEQRNRNIEANAAVLKTMGIPNLQKSPPKPKAKKRPTPQVPDLGPAAHRPKRDPPQIRSDPVRMA